MLTDRDKTYEAVLLLGRTTDTQDTSGTVLSECSTEGLEKEKVEASILGFLGEYDQIPPMYSALKVNGRKLYELAREGKTVERKSRRVVIRSIRILSMELPRVRMEVTCSKGTYIRTLCQDIGEQLEVGGCMENLLRTRVGRFRIEESIRIDDVAEAAEEGRLKELLIPLDRMFEDCRKIVIDGRSASMAYNGNFFLRKHLTEPGEFLPGERCRVYDPQGRFIAVYRYDGEKRRFTLEKMFLDPEELGTD